MTVNTLNKFRDLGLLLLRIGVGLSFILIHGWPKITGGTAMWTKLGGAMGNLGITFAPEFWGFMSAFAEFGGGVLILLGLFTRPAAFLMAFNMFVALMMHFSKLDQWGTISHPLELLAVFIGLIFLGAGQFSLDHVLLRKKHVIVKTVDPKFSMQPH
jgi:putative oxidoreductase